MPPQWLSLETAALRCHVSKRTLLRWIASGKLRAHEMTPRRRKMFILAAELDEVIAKQKHAM